MLDEPWHSRLFHAQQTVLERWIERWGGAGVAILMHVALIAILNNHWVRFHATARPESLQVCFELPADMIAPHAAYPSPPQFNPAVATVAHPEAVESEEIIRPENFPRIAALEDHPTESEAEMEAAPDAARAENPRVLLGMDQQIERELRELNKRRSEQEVALGHLRMRVRRFETQVQGQKWILDSDGGRTGAIRTLNVEHFPEEVVAEVFSRYHIRIRKNATPSTPGEPSFLNAAVTNEGTYQNVPARGPQDVFILSPTAVHFLSVLETRALQEKGFTPATTRVREIHFGIIKNAKDEWDLGVIKCVTERID
jgi:hypothetical protein